MAEPNPKVQRTAYPMLVGVVDEAEVIRLESMINEIQTLVDEVRADVVPISQAILSSNPQFNELLLKMDSFYEQFGIRVADMDLNVNPIFSAIESRIDEIDVKLVDLLAKYNVLADQQNGFHQRLRTIENALDLPTT